MVRRGSLENPRDIGITVREVLVDKVYVERGLADWNVISISISRQSRDGLSPKADEGEHCRNSTMLRGSKKAGGFHSLEQEDGSKGEPKQSSRKGQIHTSSSIRTRPHRFTTPFVIDCLLCEYD